MLLFKLSFSGLLLFWLFQQGKLDFEIINKTFKRPFFSIFCFILITMTSVLAGYRYMLLIKKKLKPKTKVTSFIKTNWIGLYFNSILPGSVTGDLVKIFYLQKFTENTSKKYLLASVFIDRIFGLFGLFINLGICSLLYLLFSKASVSESFQKLISFNLLVLVSSLLAIIILKSPKTLNACITLAQKILPKSLHPKLQDLLEHSMTIQSRIIPQVLLSVLVQFFAVSSFWILTKDYAAGEFSFIQAMISVPLGFLSQSIPLAPAGIGVGHVAFDQIFKFLSIDNGASLFNLYLVFMMTSNLIGVFPYILYKKQHNLDSAQIQSGEI